MGLDSAVAAVHIIGRTAYYLHFGTARALGAVIVISISVSVPFSVPIPVPIALSIVVPVPIRVPAPVSISATTADSEISATAAVHPNAAWLVPPRAAVIAGGVAALANHLNAPVGVSRTEIAAAVIGGAVNAVGGIRSCVASDLEIGAAAAVHPDTPVIFKAPGAVEDARGFTALLDQLHARAHVRVAIVPLHVVGGARNDLPLRGVAGRGWCCTDKDYEQEDQDRSGIKEAQEFHEDLFVTHCNEV